MLPPYPTGRANPSAGTGCCKKQTPAAERQREFITCWIGFFAQPERVLTCNG